MVGIHVEGVVEGNETTGSASASVEGAKGSAEVNATTEIASVLASVTDNNAAQGSSVENYSAHAEDPNAVPERTPSTAKEEHSSKSETAEPAKSAQSWGWTGWGNMLAAVQDAASEVPKFWEHKKRKSSFQAAAAAKGVVDALDADTGAIEKRGLSEASTSDTEGKANDYSAAKERHMSGSNMEGMISPEALGAALGNAWKGSMSFVKSFEQHVEHLAHTIQDGKLSSKAQELLEYVQKETIDIIVQETGIELEEDEASIKDEPEEETGEYIEEISFERCYYIYGGPEYLEELEALSDHNMLVCNRARPELSADQKSAYDESLKKLQDTFSTPTGAGSQEGVNHLLPDAYAELLAMQEAGVTTAADMAKGAGSGVSKLLPAAAVERTEQVLERLKTEGVHRISEVCAMSTGHLVQVAKDMLASASKPCPQLCEDKALLIRDRVDALIAIQQKVIAAFTKGLREVCEAHSHSLQESDGVQESRETAVLEACQSSITELESDGTAAAHKLVEALRHLVYVVLVTSIPS